ncbi:uncharacterized protein LOC124369788 [Homalodisca vitripennis]|uniref:uncharacterized protein LOC124369788 n=1 Tax=Homalodisca vitripennis TaxID=197043 RepID=UPI001EEA78D6|nr:uncharacterized protein LOC124369788 [Homalodisca vitripennis]
MPRDNKRVMKRKIRKNQSKRRMKRNPRGDRMSRPKNGPSDSFNIGASNTSEVATLSGEEVPLNKSAPEEEIHKVIGSDDIQQDVLHCCSASMSTQKQSNTQTVETCIKAELQPEKEN